MQELGEKRDFQTWLSNFKESISTFTYYVDFEKVVANVEAIKVELNILNALVGSKKVREDFMKIVTRYPETLPCIPILIACREYEIFARDNDEEYKFNFKKPNYTLEEYATFMEKTGLFDMLENRLTNNLYDYVLGVEAGLNSNARKNRGGHLMEDLVESYIQKSGYKINENYFKEMYLKDVESRFNLDLSAISNEGKTRKRFDFVIKTDTCVYAIETNFYASSGSKLNETARSYKTIALEARDIPNFKFVWFTDGMGWKDARNNLEETFDVLPTIYNIDELANGVIDAFE